MEERGENRGNFRTIIFANFLGLVASENSEPLQYMKGKFVHLLIHSFILGRGNSMCKVSQNKEPSSEPQWQVTTIVVQSTLPFTQYPQ